MATVNIRHLVKKKGRYYFQPSREMAADGYSSEPLGKDFATAIERANAINAGWDAERTGQPGAVRDGTVRWLVRAYQTSSWYTNLAPRTQADVDRYLAIIETAFPTARISEIARKNTRQFYDKLLEARGSTVAADGHKWLRRLLSFSIEIGLRTDNPARGMGIRHPPPRRQVWTREQVKAFCKAGRGTGWELAAMIAYDTAQRPADVLMATWADFDGEGISFTQGKTGAAVWVPLSAPTLALLAEAPRVAVQIVTVGGKPFVREKSGRLVIASVAFSRGYRAVRKAGGLPTELQFRDLRRTAATEIATGGGRIEPVTGHRPGSNVQRVYIVPNKDAARASQKARKKNR